MQKTDLSRLPDDLQKRAIFLANEAAWQRDDARDVIDILSNQGLAVLGIELWIPEEGVPRVIGWSTYNVECSGDWDDYVRANAEHALRDLEKPSADDVLFNLTWISQDQNEELSR